MAAKAWLCGDSAKSGPASGRASAARPGLVVIQYPGGGIENGGVSANGGEENVNGEMISADS